MDELDLTAAESKATYEEIKDYVLKQSENVRIPVSQKDGRVSRPLLTSESHQGSFIVTLAPPVSSEFSKIS